MFFYLFSFFSQTSKTKIYNSDNFTDNFIDLELGLGLKENSSLSAPLSTPLSTNPKNNNFFPTILIH